MEQYSDKIRKLELQLEQEKNMREQQLSEQNNLSQKLEESFDNKLQQHRDLVQQQMLQE